jgi:hypothetical protein
MRPGSTTRRTAAATPAAATTPISTSARRVRRDVQTATASVSAWSRMSTLAAHLSSGEAAVKKKLASTSTSTNP